MNMKNLTNIAVDLGIAAAFYFWIWHANQYAENVLMFLFWFVGITGILVGLFADGESKKPKTKFSRAWNDSTDLIWIVALAAIGNFATAAIYAVGAVAHRVYRERCEKLYTAK